MKEVQEENMKLNSTLTKVQSDLESLQREHRSLNVQLDNQKGGFILGTRLP
jgi:hypothetical protein